MVVVVTSCNEHPSYLEFASLVSQSYALHGYTDVRLIFVTDRHRNDPVVKDLEDSFRGTVILMPRIHQVASGIQAKCARMWYCSTLREQLCMPVDVDTLLLNSGWLRACETLATTTDRITATLECGIYDGTPDEGKFPMPYCMGTGYAFKRAVNPWGAPTPEELFMERWPAVTKEGSIDGKEDVLGDYTKFSDESLLRMLIKTQDPDVLIPYPPPHLSRKVHGSPGDRLKELSPAASTQTQDVDENGVRKRVGWRNFDPARLTAGEYIDASMPRPLSEYRDLIRPVAQWLGISI